MHRDSKEAESIGHEGPGADVVEVHIWVCLATDYDPRVGSQCHMYESDRGLGRGYA